MQTLLLYVQRLLNYNAPPRRGQLTIFQVFAARGAAWIARKEPEHEDAEEEEDDRVNGDLEGEHGDRPASVTRASSYGA